MLLDSPGGADADLSSLQLIAYGGAPMTEALLLRAMATLRLRVHGRLRHDRDRGQRHRLAPEDHDPGGPRAGLLRSVGRPLPWHEVAVLDPVTGEPSPVGEVGEIWVRSGQNTPGYWHRPDETAATLTPDGWLRTGDAALPDADGYLFLHDRIKDMIISGGENVYPAEVENALAATRPSPTSRSSACRRERWGETVKAMVVPVAGRPADRARS